MDRINQERLAHQIAHGLALYGGAATVAIAIALTILNIFCYCMIFKKAGYSGCLGCGVFIPVVGQILLIWFAFANWPAIRKRSRRAD